MSKTNDDQLHQQMLEVFPDLPIEQVDTAISNLTRYFEVLARIHARIMSDPAARAEFETLTKSGNDHTIQKCPCPQDMVDTIE